MIKGNMDKKGLDIVTQNRTKPNGGTEDRTAKAGSARKPTLPAERENRAWSLCLGRPKSLSRRQIVDLNRKLQGIIDWLPSPMPEIKADIVRLCEQAEIGRQCLRGRHDQNKR